MSDSSQGAAGALHRLTAASRALTYAASVDEVLDITVETAQALLDAPRSVLMLPDEEGLLHIRAARGVDEAIMERFREPLDETLISRLSSVFGPGAREQFLGVPLVVRGAVTGLLAVLLPEDRPAAERDEWLLSALADQASVALEGERRETTAAGMQRRLNELETQGSRREEALRMVGHDLRSPLGSMRGYLHLLRTGVYGPLTDGQETAVSRLETLIGHVDTLVGNALELGLATAGRLTVECHPLPLRPVAQASLEVVAFPAKQAEVDLEVQVADDLDVIADEHRLRQVLVQLLDNAIKFSPAHTTIRVDAAREPRPPARVTIRVHDQGPGIDPAHSDDIFQPYRRLTETGSGFGLGLSLARAVAGLMDGELEVEPTDRPGATFALRLPAPG